MPHLQFQLVDPPAGSTSDQLREIPLPSCNQSANRPAVNDPHGRRQGTSTSIDRQSKSQSEEAPRIAPADVSCWLFVHTARWLSSAVDFSFLFLRGSDIVITLVAENSSFS